MNKAIKISDCNWPIPDEESESGYIENCMNFGMGCWQCTTSQDICWCYMLRVWNMWNLGKGEVKVKTDLRNLEKQIVGGKIKLKSNLGMSSSHDPLHDEYISTFREILLMFDRMEIDTLDTFANGHLLHIVTKKPSRLFQYIDMFPIFGERFPRIWCTITTPDKKQSQEYMRDAETPFEMSHALNNLSETGFDDLGVSFGPLFGGWRNLRVTKEYFESLPPLKFAQFEPMNHNDFGLDVLTPFEVGELAYLFKEVQPSCRIYLKTEGPYQVGLKI